MKTLMSVGGKHKKKFKNEIGVRSRKLEDNNLR